MYYTPNYGFEFVPDSAEPATTVRDYRRSTSRNFQNIDTLIKDAFTRISSNEGSISAIDVAVKELQKRGIYLCSASETTTLEDGTNVPNIESPNESVVYLVSSGDAAPNMWLEYIWVNEAWEQWGSTTIDLTGYATEDYVKHALSPYVKTTAMNTYVNRNAVLKSQGIENAGKFLIVNKKGTVEAYDEFARDFWKGKSVGWFGTSITQYCKSNTGSPSNVYRTNGYPYLVSQELGLDFDIDGDNFGQAGSTLAIPSDSAHYARYGAIIDQIQTKISSVASYDLVCIECGTNDFKKDVELGSLSSASSGFDTGTFFGALQESVRKIRAVNADAMIMLIADTRRGEDINGQYDSNYVNGAGCSLIDYVYAMYDVAEYYDIIFCNWFGNSVINEDNIADYTWDGYLHLNANGYQEVSRVTVNAMIGSAYKHIVLPTRTSDLENDSNFISVSSKPSSSEKTVLACHADGTYWTSVDDILYTETLVDGMIIPSISSDNGQISGKILTSRSLRSYLKEMKVPRIDSKGELIDRPEYKPVAIVDITLPSSAWVSQTDYFEITFTADGVTSDSIQDIIPGIGITAEQLKALQAANLVDNSQDSNSISLIGYGKQPTIDIPIRVIVR